jgi:hypothetical protein
VNKSKAVSIAMRAIEKSHTDGPIDACECEQAEAWRTFKSWLTKAAYIEHRKRWDKKTPR